MLEERARGTVCATKVVFGSEPSDAELYEWATTEGHELSRRLARATPIPETNAPARRRKPNPKRAQREAAKAAQMPRASTMAQEALKADQQVRAKQSAQHSRARREELAREKREKKRAKARAKHRGH